MTSEIRVNKITNRVGLSTVEYADTGIVVSGIVTCTELSGLTALNVAGVSTFSNKIQVGTGVTIEANGQATYTGIVTASSFKLSDGSAVGGAMTRDSQGNLFAGDTAGEDLNNSSGYNVLIGNKSGKNITSAQNNIFVGEETGESITGGSGNIAIGTKTLEFAGSGASTNIAIGFNAGQEVSGDSNTIIGNSASGGAMTGQNNLILGNGAARSASGISNEITLGNSSITKFRIPGINVTLKDNGGTPTQGHVLTVDGSGEASFAAAGGGGVSSDAQENVKGGTDAGNALDADTLRNTLFGHHAGKLIDSGDDNTIIGWKAGDAITSGYKNCAVGSESLPNVTSGHNNVAMGWEAGRSLTSGNNNVCLGPMAGRSLGGGTYNIALGYHSLSNVGSPTRCIGIGGDSVFLGGTDVIGIGQGTMMKGSSQIGGIGIGRYAGRNNAGDYNIYIGYYSGHGDSSSPYSNGDNNIGLGYRSLYNIETSHGNVAIGASAGDSITTGFNNIILGDSADASSATVSNEITLGNSSITKFRIPALNYTITSGGNVGINETSPGTYLHVKGTGEMLRLETTASGGGQCYIDFDDETATRASIGLRGSSSDTLTLAAINGSMRFDVSGKTQALHLSAQGNLEQNSTGGVSYFKGSSEYVFGSNSSSPPAGGYESVVQVQGAKTRSAFAVAAYMDNSGGPFMTFISSRSGTVGTLGTKCIGNDYIGEIRFAGDNGTNYNSLANGASIAARAKSTPSDGDTAIAGELIFSTGTASGGSVPERMKISSDGDAFFSNGIYFSGSFSAASNNDYGRLNVLGSNVYGTSIQHSTTVVLTNEQGSTTQAMILGDTSPGTDGQTLWGVSVNGTTGNPTTGSESGWSQKARVEGNGDFVHSGSHSASGSDDRLKKNKVGITSALSKVCAMEGFTYEWNDVADKIGMSDGDRHFGLSAQTVEPLAPEVVVVNDSLVNPDDGTNDYKTIRYERLVPMLVEAIKDLKTENNELKSRISILEGS